MSADRPPFNASPCSGIAEGICVIASDFNIVYAGPINKAPDVSGFDVFLNPNDFERLRSKVAKSKH